jgi:ParB family chromosome partitioning protein
MVRIMCDIINVDDKESYEVALAENLQQKSMNPIEEARAFQKYARNFGWGAESDLAKKIGKVQSISVEG